MALPDSFTEEIDLFITKAEDEAKDEPETSVESGSPDSPETSEAADDLPSESESRESDGCEIFDEKTEYGVPGAPVNEDGGDGDTGEAEGSEQAESTAPAISDIALTVAVQAGMQLADARRFGSEEALLNVAERLNEARGDVALAREAQPVKPGAPEQPVDPFADLPDLDPEEYDPKVVQYLNGMKDATRAALDEKQKQMDSFYEGQAAAVQASQAVADREALQWFESEIKGLEMPEALGEGGHSDLAQGSPQLAKRDAIAAQAAVLMAGYEASGQPSPTREEIFRVSARLALADEYQALRENEVSADLEKRAGSHISRVSGGKSKSTQSPQDEVAALIDAQFPPG